MGLVIITITFALVFKLIANIHRSENLRLKTNASLLMDEIIASTVETLKFTDDFFDYGYLQINKSIVNDEGSRGLCIIHLQATDRKNKLVLEKKAFLLTGQ